MKSINLTKYQMLVTAVEENSLSAAAKKLGCTQSAVSHGIQGLEAEMGITLLLRSKAGLKLTSEGMRVLPAIRNILSGQEQLNQIVSSICGLEEGTLRIGTFTSVAVHWLPGIIKKFQEDYPLVDIHLSNGDYFDIEQWLENGSIDIGFINLPCKVDCYSQALAEDRLLAVLPENHRFAGYPKFPLQQCENEPFISLLESSNHDARKAMEAAGIQPNIKYSTKDDYAMIAMVEQGLGISIIPELLLKGRNDRIIVKELVPSTKRTIGIAIPEVSRTSPVTERFREYVVDWVKEHNAP